MADTGQYGQLIILNNTDAPTTHFDGENTTELVFGEQEAADRNGLLLDLREGQPNMMEDAVEQPRLWGE